MARSGLAEVLWAVEIVSEKDEATYRRVLERHRIDPATFVMVGNSVRSDVLPVLEIGARAVHVPYHVTWALEHAEPEPERHRFPVLESIAELPACIDRLDATARSDRADRSRRSTSTGAAGCAGWATRRSTSSRRASASTPTCWCCRSRWAPDDGAAQHDLVAEALGYELGDRRRWPAPSSTRSPRRGRPAPTRLAPKGDGDWCLALLSRLPITSSRVDPLPQLPSDPADRGPCCGPTSTSTVDRSRCTARTCRTSRWAWRRTRRAAGGPRPGDEPGVLLGDMNMWGWCISAHGPAGLAPRGRGAARFPSPVPHTASTTSSPPRRSRCVSARGPAPTSAPTTSPIRGRLRLRDDGGGPAPWCSCAPATRPAR